MLVDHENRGCGVMQLVVIMWRALVRIQVETRVLLTWHPVGIVAREGKFPEMEELFMCSGGTDLDINYMYHTGVGTMLVQELPG